jgi:hypothetical protein
VLISVGVDVVGSVRNGVSASVSVGTSVLVSVCVGVSVGMTVSIEVDDIVSVGVSVHASWARAVGMPPTPKQRNKIIPTNKIPN